MSKIYKTNVVVALGNYTHQLTRHNAGQLAIDHCVRNLIGEEAWTLDRKLGGWIAQTAVSQHQNKKTIFHLGADYRKLTFFKPREYMNLNGIPICKLLRKLNVPICEMICLHDDLDLRLGVVKFKDSGSAGGHNGLKSVFSACNSQTFGRLRIGIGRPKDESTSIDQYVLSPFSAHEMTLFEGSVMDDVFNNLLERLKLENPVI